ncbi:hypothetical protein KIN20_014302 [Parelaphostrongylus tenuis]|uniref:Uncharacterized protein n=1 Tax=Parelaphostrongylus tenuis TaxID=148309 RepID=A0AAD5MX61_PARTN|nr:hypothetical protein KIN20_014302 [Parelaphostrongylus tenuis]
MAVDRLRPSVIGRSNTWRVTCVDVEEGIKENHHLHCNRLMTVRFSMAVSSEAFDSSVAVAFNICAVPEMSLDNDRFNAI